MSKQTKTAVITPTSTPEKKHYGRKRTSELSRFLNRFTFDDKGCWNWDGPTAGIGYGIVYSHVEKKNIFAHRFSYEYYVGPIPEGLQIDHLCRNIRCVNPDHLEPVTAKVNVLRSESIAAKCAKVTHCPKGHPYDLINTHFDIRGYRTCRTCLKLHNDSRVKTYKDPATHRNKGELHTNAKLNIEQVKKIRELAASGSYNFSELGRMFNCSATNIKNICCNKIWKSVN